ncbi:MAG TPA: COX15/CtaA family protein [Cyclobacteriaceae bacterium]
MEKKRRSFYKLSISTLVAVYLLILVGGIVRSTGSGMGCPDWPKCFGAWVPPTSVSDLPENYKEQYSAYREKKNVKFARYLNAFGFKKTASAILNDKSILVESDFNATKTWVEYVNRIVGVIIGFLIFAVAISSIQFWRTERKLTVLAFLSLLLVGFQGWIGSFVVSTNLTPWTITIHMALALLIVALLIYLIHRTKNELKVESPVAFWLLVACITVLLVQLVLGTQVREAIDMIAGKIERESWIVNLGSDFVLHRSFSWLVLALHIILIVKLAKTDSLKSFSLILILLILGTILAGVGMAYFSVPPFLQPLHLLLATLTFGWQFLFLLKLKTT